MGVRSLERSDSLLSPSWSNGHLPFAKFPRSSESEWLCRLIAKFQETGLLNYGPGPQVYSTFGSIGSDQSYLFLIVPRSMDVIEIACSAVD